MTPPDCLTCGIEHPPKQSCERLLCSRCHGHRRVWPYASTAAGRTTVSDTCPRCQGSGAVYQNGKPAPASTTDSHPAPSHSIGP